VNKEVRIEVESWKRNGIRNVRMGIRKWRAKAPRGGKRAQKFLIFFLSVDRSCFTATWTLDPLVKPFGTTVKKEIRNKVVTSD